MGGSGVERGQAANCSAICPLCRSAAMNPAITRLGLGPTAVAPTTDYVLHDDRALRYSLVVMATLAHVSAAALLAIAPRFYFGRYRFGNFATTV